jgi:uncharacterized protein involved in exopolysaccharide biosynthesis
MFEAPAQRRSAMIGTSLLPPAGVLSPLNLRQLFAIIWQGRLTIFLTTAAALVAGLLFIVLAPRQYTATTELLIDPTDLRAVGADAAQIGPGNDLAVLQAESQVRILSSDAVLRPVVEQLGLERDPEFARAPGLLTRLLGSSTPTDPTAAALDTLGRHIRIKRADRTLVIDIDVMSADPEKAMQIANAIVQSYLAEQTKLRADAARQISQSLSARLEELQGAVRAAEDRVEAFKERNNLVGVNGQLVNEQQLLDMNNQLALARTKSAEAKARLDQIEQVQRNPDEIGAFPEAVQSATVGALRTQYAEVMRREAEQMTNLGSRHPAVLDIQAQAARLHSMIHDEINRVAMSARTEYRSAKANEQMLADTLETLKHSTIVTNEAQVGLRELDREVQASRAVYEAFLVRARETAEQARLDTKNIHVISPADVPLTRSWPPSNAILMLASLFIGVASGTGLVLMREPVFDGRPDRGRSSDRKPVLWGNFRRTARRATPAEASGEWRIPTLAALPAADIAFSLDAVERPSSLFAREMRKILDEIGSFHNDTDSASVLIVGAGPNDEPAALALPLAATAAETLRVLLIDADLDRRTLSAIDADDAEAGLADVAIGRRDLSDVVTVDRETNINLVPLVAAHSRRDRRIQEADIKRAFDQTRQFDLVLVSATSADGEPSIRFFAGLVDHIVLVTTPRLYESAWAESLVQRIGLDRRKIRGAVLVGVETD